MLKNIIIILIYCFISNYGFSQAISSKNVPEKVVNNFELLFPETKNPKWKKDNKNFVVDFNKDNKKYIAEFNEDGIWIRTNAFIEHDKIPEKAKEYLDINFKLYTIKTSGVEDRVEGKFYRIDVSTAENEPALLFDLQGNFVKNIKEK